MKVRFVWFWSTFNPDKNFFLEILRLNAENVEVIKDPNQRCDLEIVSCFAPTRNSSLIRIKHLMQNIPHGQPDINLLYPKNFRPSTRNFKRRIWFGPENLRPPFQQDLSGTLSFEQDDLGGFNAYCPNWYELAGILNPYFNPRVGMTVQAGDLLKPRTLEVRKTKFACAFIGKPDQMRFRAIRDLESIGAVDIFGPLVGKPVPSKTEIAREYKYVVCFENDIYPGYVTEKPLEAYLSNSVPLYWGALDLNSPINKECLINLADYKSMEHYIEHVAEIDDKAYRKVYEQPFLKRIPDLSAIVKILTG